MASSNIVNLTNLATPQPTMLLYAGLAPFGPTDDRKITANNLFATITANISDISVQFDNGLGTATVSAAGKGKLRYNNTTKTFQFSADGAAYQDIGSVFSGAKINQSAGQSIPDNTVTTLTYDTESYDTDAYHSGSGSTMTVPANGKYQLIATASFTGNGGGGFRLMRIIKNGGNAIAEAFQFTDQAIMSLVMDDQATAGDTYEVVAFQNSGAPMNLATPAAGDPGQVFTIKQLH